MTITVRQLIKFIVFLLFLFFLFYHFFLYWDFSNKCFITMKPSFFEFSNTTIKKGIKYLKSNYKPQYQDFCKYVSSINPNPACGGYGGGCFYGDNTREIYISTHYGKVKNAAKVIIHETCHAKQMAENRTPSEDECYKKDSVIIWEGPKAK